MMIRNFTQLIAITALSAILVGCASEQPPETTEVEVIEVDANTDNTGTDDSSTVGIVEEIVFDGDELDNPDPNNLLLNRVVYFDFDKSDVRPEDRPTIEAHAQYLQRHPGATISLEGHADERGTREYNNALGERLAKAVRNLMTIQGGSGQQIRVVSWGEERPIDRGHDEIAWAANRRVEIVYLTRN